jgi:hypothetical protein
VKHKQILAKKRHTLLVQLVIVLFFLTLCVSCAVTYKKPLVIWTNRAEFVSYIELFNASQSEVKAIAVYKAFPSADFPPEKGETYPDIVIAPGLKSHSTRSLFSPLNYLFTEKKVSADSFYDVLYEQGVIGGKPYLIPVSFNLPAIIFSVDNQNMLATAHLISLEQMRDSGESFNAQNKSVYTSMGFGPSWENSFLYTAAKLKGARFRNLRGQFVWDESKLEAALAFLREWTGRVNTSTADEEDFDFKYLYMPQYRQVTSGKCLFAYITSDVLFMIPSEQLQKIDFRWLHEDLKIPVEDSCVYMGITKKAVNETAAEIFVSWFFQEETQRALIERASAMRLNIGTFGISGGFSSIRQVTEHVFPTYYPLLFGNLPSPDYLFAPEMMPAQWLELRDQVVLPYLAAAVDTRNPPSPNLKLQVFLAEWNKRLF